MRPGYYLRFSIWRWIGWQIGRVTGSAARGLGDGYRSATNVGDRPRLAPFMFLILVLGSLVVLFLAFLPTIQATVCLVSLGILVLILRVRMPRAVRALLYFVVGSQVVWGLLGAAQKLIGDSHPGLQLGAIVTLLVVFGLGLIATARYQPASRAATRPGEQQAADHSRARWSNVPQLTFADVGGLESEKEEIRRVVHSRLNPERYAAHGVVQNGILLYGPRGTGKTFLAEATAGEFRLNFSRVSPTELISQWVGATQANIRKAFEFAASHRPVLLFIDEVDALGTRRQQLGSADDAGGAAREYNAMATELMQRIDGYRGVQGLVIMAATNFVDSLDRALIREGRFDVKIRVDLPDAEARRKILAAQLATRPWKFFDLEEFANKTVGWSAARLQALVNRAALIAAESSREIEAGDLRRALEQSGGKDRPAFKPVEWGELVLPTDVERDLRNLIDLLEPGYAERLRVPVPTGLLFLGPPGTGKSTIARLLATQTQRSFYPITPADVLGARTGESVKVLREVFARATENAPSILFFDEMDGLFPRNPGYLSQHDIQLVEQALILISELEAALNVFLVGTTNHIEAIDPRILRGGRFSEKIEIGVPGKDGYRDLLVRYLDGVQLDPSLTLDELARRLVGIPPADLEAFANAAKRMAMHRMEHREEALPPLIWADFEGSIRRVSVNSPAVD